MKYTWCSYIHFSIPNFAQWKISKVCIKLLYFCPFKMKQIVGSFLSTFNLQLLPPFFSDPILNGGSKKKESTQRRPKNPNSCTRRSKTILYKRDRDRIVCIKCNLSWSWWLLIKYLKVFALKILIYSLLSSINALSLHRRPDPPLKLSKPVSVDSVCRHIALTTFVHCTFYYPTFTFTPYTIQQMKENTFLSLFPTEFAVWYVVI
jgi:hypothetical protein